MSNEENLSSEEIKSLRSLIDIERIKELRYTLYDIEWD